MSVFLSTGGQLPVRPAATQRDSRSRIADQRPAAGEYEIGCREHIFLSTFY